MKLTTKQLRIIIKEELQLVLREEGSEKYGIGAISQGAGRDEWHMSVTLIDLDVFAEQLKSMEPEQFMKNLHRFANNKTSIAARDELVVAFIEARDSIPYKHGWKGTGSFCSYTWWIARIIGAGYGKDLFSAIFGLAARHNRYLTIDRNHVEDKAFTWWEKGVRDLKDSVPKNEDPYKGSFDDWRNQTTAPKDDDCKIHPDHPLANKGFMGTQTQIDALKKMEENLDNFFKKVVIDRFDEPGFLAKHVLGVTDASKVQKFKNKLSHSGGEKFDNWWNVVRAGVK
tara:strand:- start:1570 stop:2421 length:852 start_codon:yes stop_codon:yes gene_type:complete